MVANEISSIEKDRLAKVRTRQYSVQRNMEYDIHDENKVLLRDLTPEEWKKEVIRDFENIDALEKWLIFHDSDLDEHGRKKGLHAHGILYFKNPKKLSALCKEFNVQSRNVQEVKKGSGAFRYLLHITDTALREKKYIYSFDDLMVWVKNERIYDTDARELYSERCKGKEINRLNGKKEEVIKDLASRVLRGDMFYNEISDVLQEEFGVVDGDYIFLRNLETFDNAKKQRFMKRVREKERSPRKLDTIFISGESGIGKTYFADELSIYMAKMNKYDENEFYQHSSAANNNGSAYYMLEEYNGEPVLVMNDIAGNEFSYDEFKTRFETTARKAPSVPNRYKNKKFIADVCLITYAKSVYSWADSIIYDGVRLGELRESVEKQVFRRIPYWVSLEQDRVVIKKFNLELNDYEVIKEFNQKLSDRLENGMDEIFDYVASLTSLYKK